jgi:WD40 repeat protein
MNNYFWADKEIEAIQNRENKIFSSDSNYRGHMTNFLLAGLKSLGYDRALSTLEEESGQRLPRILDEEIKTLIRKGAFDEAIAYTSAPSNLTSLTSSQRSFLLFEMLKLKYIAAISKGDTVVALYLLRNEMKNYEHQFNVEKKFLSQLYLLKDKHEIYQTTGINLESKSEMENYVRLLEYRILTNNEHCATFEDPFEIVCRNNLAFQLINCKYHNFNRTSEIDLVALGHGDVRLPLKKSALQKNNRSPGRLSRQSPNLKDKKLSLHSNNHDSSHNHNNDHFKTPTAFSVYPNIQEMMLGIQHQCQLEYIPETPYQKLSDAKDEIWKIKSNKNGMRLMASTRSRFIYSWLLEPQSGKYLLAWRTQLEAREDINDFSLNEVKDLIVVATSDNSLIVLDAKQGQKVATIQKAHNDSVNSVYCFTNGEDYVTGSIDGYINLWDASYQIRREIKTHRIVFFVVRHDESALYFVHGNSKAIDELNLETFTLQSKIIQEKHQIISGAIDPDDQYLLVNTSYELPELHLWRLKDMRLLNVFSGHDQLQYVIGCGFLSSTVIFCGSEKGALYYWHINQEKCVKRIKVHEHCLNWVVAARVEMLNRTIVATASDDSNVQILI